MRLLLRDIENMRSLLREKLNSIGNLGRMHRPGIECGGEFESVSQLQSEATHEGEYMVSEGQLLRMRGMETWLAVRATFTRGFGWSTTCRTRQRNVCIPNVAPMSQEEQQPLDASVAAFRRQCSRFRSRRDRWRQKQWRSCSGGLKWASTTRTRSSEFSNCLLVFLQLSLAVLPVCASSCFVVEFSSVEFLLCFF